VWKRNRAPITSQTCERWNGASVSELDH